MKWSKRIFFLLHCTKYNLQLQQQLFLTCRTYFTVLYKIFSIHVAGKKTQKNKSNQNLASHINLGISIHIDFCGFAWHQLVPYSSRYTITRRGIPMDRKKLTKNYSPKRVLNYCHIRVQLAEGGIYRIYQLSFNRSLFQGCTTNSEFLHYE